MSDQFSHRRCFLRTSLAASAGVLASCYLPHASWAADADAKFKISLAEWSLHKTIFGGKLDNLEFAKFAK
ncbi:MAG: hypothetical protein KDA60_07360, partial [Planctomycetales bacterium]|nr:hypothetical protein [Planctomycetales bacterium]